MNADIRRPLFFHSWCVSLILWHFILSKVVIAHQRIYMLYKKKIYKKFQYSEFVCDWNDGLNKTAVENDMSPAVSRKPIKFDSVFSFEWISFHLMCMCNCCSNDVLHEYKIVLFYFLNCLTWNVLNVSGCMVIVGRIELWLMCQKHDFFLLQWRAPQRKDHFYFPSHHITSHLFMSFIFEVQPMSPLKCSK